MKTREWIWAKIIECDQLKSFGLLGSVRRMLATTLALCQSRLELIALELREEKKRVLAVVLWGMALVFFVFMALVALVGVVVFLFWDSALAVLIGFGAFFIVLAVGSFFAARNKLGKMPLGETVDQLRKDREAFSEEPSRNV